MYVFVDELGNLEPPSSHAPTLENQIFFLGALVVRTNKSRRRVAVAVTRSIRELGREHLLYSTLGWVPELKGTELTQHTRVRTRLFRRIKKEDLQFYGVLVEKRGLRQKLAYAYGRRYSRIALNLIARIPIPTRLRRITLTIDRGGGGRPRQHRQSLIAHFRNTIKPKWTHLEVQVRESHTDRCLQMADVFTHFVFEGYLLKERMKELETAAVAAEQANERTRLDKLLARFKKRQHWWIQARNILRRSFRIFTVPPHRLYRGRVRNLVARRIAAQRKKRGNHGR